MYFLGNGSNRIITKKAQIDTFQELATGDSVSAKYVVHGSAKAWANLNGTGTIALRDSLNVASVVDNGVGDYTHNLTAAMNDANYMLATGYIFNSGVNEVAIQRTTLRPCTINQVNIRGQVTAVGASDAPFVDWNIHGDLA